MTAEAAIKTDLHAEMQAIGQAARAAAAELALASPEVGLGALDALPVGLLVLVIGLSLGGTTGYAINPARDLSPRIMHAILPIGTKRDSDWEYSWVPVVGPTIGAILAALAYRALSLSIVVQPMGT